jgi:hypothetical protein
MIINDNVFPWRRKIRRQGGSKHGREGVRDPIEPRHLGGNRVGNLTHFLNR